MSGSTGSPNSGTMSGLGWLGVSLQPSRPGNSWAIRSYSPITVFVSAFGYIGAAATGNGSLAPAHFAATTIDCLHVIGTAGQSAEVARDDRRQRC
ncbi:MAG: hypothetical protein AAFY28_05885 [Actinomycetota bacterium]